VLALSKPPYLRWAAAGAIVLIALIWDLSGRATQRVPFAAQPIESRAIITESAVEWESVPDGLFPVLAPVGATAAIALAPGDPISPSVLTSGVVVPSDWWTVPVATPAAAVPGVQVRLVLPDGQAVTGVVVEPSREDSFGIQSAGLVAVPPEVADSIGLAAAAGQLIVLYSP